MKQLIRDSIPLHSDGIFHDKFQDLIDEIAMKGKKFNVEEYYNDMFSVYVVGSKIYTFRTVEQFYNKGSHNDKIIGTINEVDINELYAFMLKKRKYSEYPRVKSVFDDIKEYFSNQVIAI